MHDWDEFPCAKIFHEQTNMNKITTFEYQQTTKWSNVQGVPFKTQPNQNAWTEI